MMEESAVSQNTRSRKARVKKVAVKLMEETTGVAAESAASEVVDAIAPEIAEVMSEEVLEVIADAGAESMVLMAAEWITSEIFDAVIWLALGAFRITSALYKDVKETGAPGISTFRSLAAFLCGVIGAYFGSKIGNFVGESAGNGIGLVFGDEAGQTGSTVLAIVLGILVAVAGRLGGIKVANKLIDRYKNLKAVTAGPETVARRAQKLKVK